KRNDIDSDLSNAWAAASRRKNRKIENPAVAYGILHLLPRPLILNRAAILVEESQSVIHAGNLIIGRAVENPIAAADHRLVIFERVPRERDAGSQIVQVAVQRSVFGVRLVAQPQ